MQVSPNHSSFLGSHVLEILTSPLKGKPLFCKITKATGDRESRLLLILKGRTCTANVNFSVQCDNYCIQSYMYIWSASVQLYLIQQKKCTEKREQYFWGGNNVSLSESFNFESGCRIGCFRIKLNRPLWSKPWWDFSQFHLCSDEFPFWFSGVLFSF